MQEAVQPVADLRSRVRTEQVTVDAVRAQEILRTETWARQRPLRLTHVRTLLTAYRAGEVTDFVLIFCQTPDGQRHLIDGQHRLHMLVEADGVVSALEITYLVADEEEIERRYLSIDRHSRRTPEDMLIAAGLLERSTYPSTTVKRISRAALIVYSNFGADYKRIGLSLLARREATEQWLGAGELFAEMLQGATMEVSKRLWRSSVAAVGLATVNHVFDGRAQAFWQGIARDEGLLADDPRKALLSWLRGNSVAARGSEMEYARYVARAWNAWYEGRQLSKLQGPRSGPGRPPPTPIMGTPYRVG